MTKKKLFDNDDSDEDITIKTENEYAKKYDTWREREEIHKLEQKYGSKELDPNDEGSSDSDDDSDGLLEVNEEMEEQFLKTLALLKTKDPRIYDPNFKFFDEEKREKQEEKPKTKTLTFEDSDEDDDDGEIFKIEKKAEINDKLKEQEQTVSNNVKDEKGKKIKEYLTGKAEHVDKELDNDLAPLKALWSDPKLNEGEAFLRDYILNKRYLDDGDVQDVVEKVRDDADLETDERTVEEQAKFERAYNFRFEEPDEEYLKRFPRTMNYIRPKDDRRARKRAEVRARKEEEKKKKMEEIARLKALKLKEIQEKIARIKEVTGNQDLAFKEEDIEGDFDPEEHDRRMRALFDDQYYDHADHTKPHCPDLDDELDIENWDKYDVDTHEGAPKYADEGPHCEDDDFNMDADYDPKQPKASLLEEIQKSLGKKRRNRKRKSKLAELLTVEKPKYVPTVAEKTYAQYMEEYYKMDCEDIIGGDLPTRFKYREVVPNDYGLTVEEILLADDKELTQWVPLKKLVKHRPEAAERGDLNTYKLRAQDLKLKKKLLPSLFKDLPEEPEVVVPVEEATRKKKKKKKNKQNKEEVIGIENNSPEVNGETAADITEAVTKKKKKKRKVNSESDIRGEEPTVNEIKKKKEKHKVNGFVVTDAMKEGPSQDACPTNIDKVKTEIDETVKIGSKRKLTNENSEVPHKKKKKKNKPPQQFNGHKESNDKNKSNKKQKQKNKYKNTANDKANENPLNKLSDERLKAYGLNPKKYRGFLKYKKF